MESFRVSRAPISIKLLLTSLLCVIGLTYILLLLHVWHDTEMKVSLVRQAYETMETIELTNITHMYLPYYALFLFAIPAAIFMFTSYPEKLKRVFAVLPFILCAVDIGSMWSIPYIHKGFSLVLWLAGTSLASVFLTLYILNIYDIWFRKQR